MATSQRLKALFLHLLTLSFFSALAYGDVTITGQPVGEEVFAGENASFSIQATASPGDTLLYQWFFNGNAISNATNATVTITNVQSTNVGLYYAKVGNLQGSKESAHVTLTASAGVVSQIYPAVEIVFPTQIGMTYQIQNSTDLVTWNNVSQASIADADSVTRLFSTRTNSHTYYRALQRFQTGPLASLNGQTFVFSPNGLSSFQAVFSGTPGALSGSYATTGSLVDANTYTYSVNALIGNWILPGASYRLDFSTLTYIKTVGGQTIQTGSFSYHDSPPPIPAPASINGKSLNFNPAGRVAFTLSFSGTTNAVDGNYVANGSVIDNGSYTYSGSGGSASVVVTSFGGGSATARYDLDFALGQYTKSQFGQVIESGTFTLSNTSNPNTNALASLNGVKITFTPAAPSSERTFFISFTGAAASQSGTYLDTGGETDSGTYTYSSNGSSGYLTFHHPGSAVDAQYVLDFSLGRYTKFYLGSFYASGTFSY